MGRTVLAAAVSAEPCGAVVGGGAEHVADECAAEGRAVKVDDDVVGRVIDEQFDVVAEIGAAVEHLPVTSHLIGNMKQHLRVMAHDKAVMPQQLFIRHRCAVGMVGHPVVKFMFPYIGLEGRAVVVNLLLCPHRLVGGFQVLPETKACRPVFFAGGDIRELDCRCRRLGSS